MTDWMPIVGVGLAGVLTTLGLMLQERASAARGVFWATVAATVLLYGTYLVLGEDWLWYT